MAVTLCILLSLAIYPYLASASADIEFQLREFAFTSELGSVCCGQESAETTGCLSVCPYRLQFCIGSSERWICSQALPLDRLNPGSEVTHISVEYIKTRMEVHILLVTDTEEEDILSD
ncbi:uncharacterized protein LOC117324797, partial [Pecten maximus]|uniref:uncharacterized protein LOC117324797 n=1 Tax=Pecten maximus TaxID=6579 RepID=UPI00145856DF